MRIKRCVFMAVASEDGHMVLIAGCLFTGKCGMQVVKQRWTNAITSRPRRVNATGIAIGAGNRRAYGGDARGV